MKAIILSAGQGSRLLPLTADRPKCLIELSGRTLLDWQLDALEANGIDEVVVVVGFRADAVEAHLAQRGQQGVRTLFNPFFQVADNLGSVWLAGGEMDRDFLILNGDTVVTPELVAAAIAGAGAPVNVTVDRKPTYDADDMKVTSADGRLLAIGKTLALDTVDAESIGLLLFRGAGVAAFRGAVEAMMRTAEGTKNWYLKAIDRLAKASHVGIVSIEGHEWGEVDFPADVVAARSLTARWASGYDAVRASA